MPSADDPLNDTARQLLSARADQFHSALRGGRDVDWDSYIGDLTGTVREAVLIELVHIDLEHRSKAGKKPRLEEYLRRFPDLGPAARVPEKLIVEEFRCRAAAGEAPEPSSYRARFPDQFDKIRPTLEGMASHTVAKSTPAAGTHALELGKQVSDQYELIKQLGRGMFGEVWLAKKNPSGIEKAIKILLQPMDMDSAQRELRSLELIKNLRHPYLLATEDFWVSDGRLHIAMELADSTVKARLKSCQAVGMGAIPVEEAIQYTAESAEGLDYLHEHKVMHRDVKPDNILLLRGHAKVADFGLARQQDQVMASMTFAGTPAYMAPEVWGGEGGPASDQYSLALVYAELRQGRSLLKIGPMSEMMLAHLDGKFDFADFIPEEERQVVRKALAKVPAERYPTCLQFAVELSRTLGRNSMRAPSMAGAMARSGSIKSTTSRSIAGSMAATQSVGAFDATGTHLPAPSQTAGNTKTKSGTVANTATAPRTFVGARPVKAGPPKKLIAGILAVVLLSVVGILAFLLFGPTPTPPTSNPTTTPTTDTPTTTKPTTEIVATKSTTIIIGSQTLPVGSKAEPGAKSITLTGNRTLPEWINFEVNGETIRFRLIPAPSPVKPFYILESKAWNRLTGTAGPPDFPTFNMTRDEAAAFAKQKFGGALPTTEQWDIAAGGLMLADGKAWVDHSAPGRTHGEKLPPDINAFGLIDMAGNGWEWTTGKIELPGGKEKAILRGRNFTFAKPLTPALLKDEQAGPFTQYPEKGSPYTSFRVVVPLP